MRSSLNGGFSRKSELTRGNQRAIDIVIKKLGGPASVARKMEVVESAPALWRRRGRVPWKYIPRLARIAGCDPWIFDYKQLCFIFQRKSPTWDEVVRALPYDESLKRWIMAATPPKRILYGVEL